MSSEYIWTEVWLVDCDAPSYLMQILARVDGTYELHDPQLREIVRRSADYNELANELVEDEYGRVFGPRVYDPSFDPYLKDGAPEPHGSRVKGMWVFLSTGGAVDLELAADLSPAHVPETEGRRLFSLTPEEAVDLGRALIKNGEIAKQRAKN